MTPEGKVEQHLVGSLTGYGFKVLKLEIPGNTGLPDRLIMRPKWSPGAPSIVEVKAPGEKPRKLQVEVMADMEARGFKVHQYVDTKEAVDVLVTNLVGEAVWDLSPSSRFNLPEHIVERWQQFNHAHGIKGLYV